MLTAKKVKEYAKKCGADIVGIGSMDRFEGAPKEMDPRYIFPEAKAIIGFGFRIPRGCFRGIEEGTYFAAYPSMGYAGINLVYAPSVLREVVCMIENEGYEAVPIQNMVIQSSVDILQGKKRNISVPVAPGKPAPDILLHFRIAAVACGMGEIGYSKMFLSPEFGPRQRLVFMLTDAPLEPDPIFEGNLCDRCMNCVKECSGKAISKTKTIKIKVAEKEIEWGELNEERCLLAYTGGARKTSPFLPSDFKDIDFDKIERDSGGYSIAGTQELYYKTPYNAASVNIFHHLVATEGAKGCIRACMIHLEEQGKLKNKFKKPFRKKKLWSLGGINKELGKDVGMDLS